MFLNLPSVISQAALHFGHVLWFFIERHTCKNGKNKVHWVINNFFYPVFKTIKPDAYKTNICYCRKIKYKHENKRGIDSCFGKG